VNQPRTVSIVVPTHNRSAQLAKSLAALAQQSWPANEFEVLVIADACQDDTAEMVTAFAALAPYRLHLLSHNAKSAAATRNLGADNAQGEVLLFLDDDVVPQPGWLQAHLAAHHSNEVVLGYSKPVLPAQPSWWQYDARRWWEDTFREMGRLGHRFTYRDLFSGNVSLPTSLFRQIGGFDLTFSGRLEDYELGLRLLKAGAKFHFAPEALGYHYDTTDLVQWLRRIRHEGVAHVQMGESHPELCVSLFPEVEACERWRRVLRGLAWAYPKRGDRLEWLLLRLAALSERLRLRYRWDQVVRVLREYNYWRGVAATIGGRQKLAAWLQEVPLPAPIASDAPIIDMAALPPPSTLQSLLEQGNRSGLRLTLDGMEVLTLSPEPGAEPLREEHLHSALRALTEQKFIPALALRLVQAAQGGPVWQSN